MYAKAENIYLKLFDRYKSVNKLVLEQQTTLIISSQTSTLPANTSIATISYILQEHSQTKMYYLYRPYIIIILSENLYREVCATF